MVHKSMHRLQNKFMVAEWPVEQIKHKKTLLGFGTCEDEKNKKKLLRFFKLETKPSECISWKCFGNAAFQEDYIQEQP